MTPRERELLLHLEALEGDVRERLQNDPIRFVHRYTDPGDQEIAGLLASGLAYGRVTLFSPVLARLFDVADTFGGPSEWVRTFDRQASTEALEGMVYRFNRGPDFVELIGALQVLLEPGGRLGDGVVVQAGEPNIGPALSRFIQSLRAAVVGNRGGAPFSTSSRGLRYLLVDPADGSAAKRLLMWARWMVRSDAVDRGVWTHIAPSALVIPLDTHVARISRLLGLLERRSTDWRAAVELTAALQRLDPEDPLRFDFALAHIGISHGCRGRHVEEVCTDCALRTLCVEGRGSSRLG